MTEVVPEFLEGLDEDEFDSMMEEHHASQSATIEKQYIETCDRCNGTGLYIRGMYRNSCFTCKGTGKRSFKLPLEARLRAQKYAANKRAATRAEIVNAAKDYRELNPVIATWLIDNSKAGNTFATSLVSALDKYGNLTEKQEAAVYRSILNEEQRQKTIATKLENAPSVNVDRIREAFDKARENDIKRPKLRLGEYVFSRAPDTGKNAGAIYVKRGEDYMGKVQAGRFIRYDLNCNPESESDIVLLASDPKQAAVAYGKRTGNCSCCGRTLTNHASIDQGIGPICAEKFGL